MATEIEQARLEEYRAQYQKDPSSLVFAVLAEACRREGLLEEAELVCSNGLRIHPAYVTGHLVMADILLERNRPEGAEAEYRAVLRLDPNNPVARLGLAQIYLQRQEVDRAIEQLDLVLFLYPGNEGAQKLMEQALRMKDEGPKVAAAVSAEVEAPAEMVAPQPPAAAPEAPPPPLVTPQAPPAEVTAAPVYTPVTIPAPPEEELLRDDEITPERALFIAQKDEELLHTLGRVAGVKEAMLVGRDGLVVAAAGQTGTLDEVTAALVSGFHVSAEGYVGKLALGLLRETTVEADGGIVRIVRVGNKVLIVLLAPDTRLGMVNLHIANTAARILQLYRRH